jgi:hypothetical protein
MTLQEETLGAGRGFRTDAQAPDRDLEYAALQLLTTHGQREGAALAAYERVAGEATADDAVTYLIGLIMDDERRHHRVFEEMANELKSFVWEVDVAPRVPSAATRKDPALLAETKKLLAFEKEDAKELRQLQKVLRRGPKSSLHPLLVELMLHDTAKHIAILEFIRSHLSAR